MGLISIFTRSSEWNRRRTALRGATSRAISVLLWAIVFVAVFPVWPVDAYIDPGSGSLLLQMILAGLAGAAFYFRNLIGAGVRKILGRDRSVKVAEESETHQGPGPEG